MAKLISKRRILIWILRIGLFSVVLGLGTVAAIVIDETPGLALTELPDASVQAMTTTTQREVSYLLLKDSLHQSQLYRSDDQGRTWQSVSSGFNLSIQSLAAHPINESVLYAGTGGGPMDTAHSVWYSQNGGQTWQPFNLNLPANPDGLVPSVTVITTDPNRAGVLYAGTDGQGVYRFEDGQVGYKLVGGTSLPAAHVKDLVMGPESRLYGLTNEGLFVMVDNRWQKLASVPEIPVRLAVAPTDPEILYAGGPSNGVYRSSDGGRSWQHASNGLGIVPGAAVRITALVVDEQDSQHLMTATAYGLGDRLAPGGIYESDNGGRSWTKIAELEEIVTQLDFNNGSVYGATAKGLEHYGQPVEAASTTSLSQLTGTQYLVLILTTALAGLVLVGRTEWFLGRNQAKG